MTASPLRRLFRNASVLLSGGVLGAVFAFITTLVSARYLGAEGLGIIVLAQTTVLTVDKLVNFQSWTPVIKYGADALESGEEGAYERVLKFGTVLDLVSAVATAVCGTVAVFLVSAKFGWSPSVRGLAVAFALLSLLNLTGTPTAILQMFDRFSVFVWQRIASGLCKVVGVLAAWYLDAGMAGVLLAWIVGDVVGRGVVMFFGWQEAAARGHGGFMRASLAGIREAHPGIVSFAISTNLATSVRRVSSQIDDFVIAFVLGERAVGLYKIAKQFGALFSMVSDPLRQATYPDFAKAVAAGNGARLRRTLLGGTGAALFFAVPGVVVFAFFGELVLRLTVGEEFVPATGILTTYTMACAVGLVTFSLSPLAQALGRANLLLVVNILATLVYVASLAPLLRGFDLAGAGYAYGVFYVAWAIILVGLLARPVRMALSANGAD